MNRNRGCAQFRSWFCITFKEQFPDKWPQVKFWPTANWLDPNPTCCLFSSKCEPICLFLFFLSQRQTFILRLPPIRAESVLMVLTRGWPGSTGSGWSGKRNMEKVETKIRETAYRRMAATFKAISYCRDSLLKYLALFKYYFHWGELVTEPTKEV